MKKIILQAEEFELTVCYKIEEIAENWSKIANPQSFLDVSYLLALEKAPPVDMKFLYVMISSHGKFIGKLYFQILPFEADKSLKIEVPSICENFFESLSNYTKKYLASKIKLTSLILGNMLLTGQHGFEFTDEFSIKDQHIIISKALKSLFKHPKLIYNSTICLIKDFSETRRISLDNIKSNMEFYEFQIQPGMRFHPRPAWNDFQDYLNALNSKSRLRIKKAIDSLKDLSFQELSLEEIENSNAEIYQLYKAVAENVGFNVININPNYFSSLKQNLGSKFKLFALKQEGKIIAFFSFVIHHEQMLAHFLGFEKKGNQKEKIYTNILINHIEQGIKNHVNTIDFGRTALEIKSSVGAEEEKLYCYITHRSKLYNKFLNKLLDLLKPEEPWTKRNPFKEN
ncbi:MAG TPA: peptidogalycan biosysnthesis protein [Saprospiraceae bacterium]|nr:peptidogalycan biosysnthesis protein [Saprospiraceae bacterium]